MDEFRVVVDGVKSSWGLFLLDILILIDISDLDTIES